MSKMKPSVVLLLLLIAGPIHADSEDEETATAFDLLLSYEIVASGYFSELSTPGADPYSPENVVRQFEIIEMFHGPDLEALNLMLDSDLFAVLEGDISVYQMRRALHERTGLLSTQLVDVDEKLRSDSLTNGLRSRYVRWQELMSQQLARIVEERPKLYEVSRRVGGRHATLYDVGAVVEGVKYLVLLNPPSSEGHFFFPTEVNVNVFWGDAAEELEDELRDVLASKALVDQLEQARRDPTPREPQ